MLTRPGAASGTEGLDLTSLEGSKVEGGGMVQHTVILLTITTVLLLLTSGQQTTGPCPSHGTSCILRHLLSQGLIRKHLPFSIVQSETVTVTVSQSQCHSHSVNKTFKLNN